MIQHFLQLSDNESPSPSSTSKLKTPSTTSMTDESDSFCESDKVSIVEKLLKFGARPDSIDLEGQSGLHLAIRGGHAVVAKRLLQAGADPNLRDKKVNVKSFKIV